ncbi:MAG: glycosyltransferase family 4 protein [Candidatus Krumholzibacteriia bacterium]
MTLPGVCFVNSLRGWGGAEVWTLDTALGLRARGHAVSIVAQPGSALLARARSAGLTAEAVPIRFDAAPWTLARLCRVMRRRRPDAVWCNLTKDLKAAGVAARLCGVPVVLASRESDFPLKNKLYYRWYFNRIATTVLVNSEATRASVLADAPWLDPARVRLLYKGIDATRFHPAPAPPAVPTVGFAGQLIARKGLPELMAAWALVEAAPWPVPPRLRLAGEGPLADGLRAWRSGLRHPDAVRLDGLVEDMPAFYRELSLLVLPSRAEGFGLAAAEASACGLPVVATAASSLPEVILHDETGLLVPPRDPVALAAAVSRLLAEPDTARRLGAAGRLHVQRRFSRRRVLDDLAALLVPPGAA